MSELDLDRRIAAALRAPVARRPGAREAIMERVRALPADERPRRRGTGASARSVRHSVVGLALAASVGSITALSALAPRGDGLPLGAPAGVIGDSVVATLRDTLRLVRLIFDDSAARQVAVVGDFNGWRVDATLLRRDSSRRRWSAVLALRDGEHRYAFVVDGTRWVPDPSASPIRGDDGRLYSLLHVARASN